MKKVYLVILATGLLSCSTNSSKSTDGTSADSASVTAQSVKKGNVEITDNSNYSSAFIDELVAANYEQPIKLTKEYMTAGTDTIGFPSDLALNKPVVFTGNKTDKRYTLEVTRINNTSVNYKFELTDDSKKVLHSETGKATLNALFFLGAESDEDEKQEAYDVISYTASNTDSNCFFSVRIETGAGEKGRAKLSFGCNDTSKPALALEDSPVLKAQ